MPKPHHAPVVALGLDAGGTQTRWAVAGADGVLRAQGHAAGLTGLQLASDEGCAAIAAVLAGIATAAGPVQAVLAGVTGFDEAQAPLLRGLVAAAFGLAPDAVRTMSDIELTCHAAGPVCVLYAGTGSIAAYLDDQGVLQRAGGRGALIDDAGGGHWIAREALCAVWRAEDAAPGCWRASPLACRLFERIGGADWACTRQWVYGATRGELGTLALAVAEAAPEDPAAADLLRRAGTELARLPLALAQRPGAPALAGAGLVLAGRVFDLHPAVEQGLREALPPGTPLRRLPRPAHEAAALLAAAGVAA